MVDINPFLAIPAGDCNFKAALKNATDEQLAEAEETLDLQLQVGFRVKAKLLAVRREIKGRSAANGREQE